MLCVHVLWFHDLQLVFLVPEEDWVQSLIVALPGGLFIVVFYNMFVFRDIGI